jgi:hypothetical protein
MRRLLVPCVLVALTACSLPAFTFDDYRGKAVEAAEEAISQGETATLTAELARRDRLFPTSVAVQLEDAEEAAVAVVDGFASVLPPDEPSEQLRRSVLPLIQDTSDLIARMRFAARHGDVARLRELTGSLEDPLRRLEAFVEQTA